MKFNLNFEKSILMAKKLFIFSTDPTTPKVGPRKNEKISLKIENRSRKTIYKFHKPVIQS